MAREPRRMRRGPKMLALGALALLVGAAAAVAQSAPLIRLEERSFLIERITVEGVTAFAPEIVLAESQLEAGRRYSEHELGDAVHRIRRLPLVLDVELSLRKGGERERYELVIRVRETRRWFWGLEVHAAGWSEPVSVNGTNTTSFTKSSLGLIGRRFGAGRHGIAHVALGGTEGAIQVGYGHYDLFGRGGFASIIFGLSDCDPDEKQPSEPSEVGESGCQTELVGLGLDPTYSNWSSLGGSARLRLAAGYPLGGNRSLRLKAFYRATESGLRRLALDTDPERLALVSDRRDVAVNLSWVFDSIDDPVFPSRGTLATVGLDVQSLAAELVQYRAPGAPTAVHANSRSRQIAAVATATRYWPSGETGSYSLGAEALLGRAHYTDLPGYDLERLGSAATVWSASATAGYGVFVKRIHTGERWRELRWESSAQLSFGGISPSMSQHQVPRYGARMTTGLTYRNTWGVLRFTLGWVGLEARP